MSLPKVRILGGWHKPPSSCSTCRLLTQGIPQVPGFVGDYAFKYPILTLIPRDPLKPGIRNVGSLQRRPSTVVVGILDTPKATYGLRVNQPDIRVIVETSPGLSKHGEIHLALWSDKQDGADLLVFHREHRSQRRRLIGECGERAKRALVNYQEVAEPGVVERIEVDIADGITNPSLENMGERLDVILTGPSEVRELQFLRVCVLEDLDDVSAPKLVVNRAVILVRSQIVMVDEILDRPSPQLFQRDRP